MTEISLSSDILTAKLIPLSNRITRLRIRNNASKDQIQQSFVVDSNSNLFTNPIPVSKIEGEETLVVHPQVQENSLFFKIDQKTNKLRFYYGTPTQTSFEDRAIQEYSLDSFISCTQSSGNNNNKNKEGQAMRLSVQFPVDYHLYGLGEKTSMKRNKPMPLLEPDTQTLTSNPSGNELANKILEQINEDIQSNVSSQFDNAIKPSTIATESAKASHTNIENSKFVKWELWNRDAYYYDSQTDLLYHCCPLLLLFNPTHKLYSAIFVDNHSRHVWHCCDRSVEVDINVVLKELNIYILAGNSPAEVLEAWAELSGKAPMPPLYALGYHQCRWSYYPESKVMSLAHTFREKNIPCDVLWLDIDYMSEYRCFTWNEKNFPEPKKMTKELLDMGMRLVVIIDPGLQVNTQYDIYTQAIKGDYCCKIYDANNNIVNYVGRVWPGQCVFPDFTDHNARLWWGTLYKGLVEDGVSGFWNDMNEPAIFDEPKTMPGQVIHGRGSHSYCHNVYGLLMARATYEGLEKLQVNRRPFVLTRSGFAGVQKYAWHWTGDNQSSEAHLKMGIPMCLNFGLVGVSGIGIDIGGFFNTPSPQLFARFMELGAFLPFYRTHSATRTPDQEPWSFGPEVEAISRDIIQLRYRLMPYLYTWFHHYTTTGVPLMRALFVQYPEDPACYDDTWESTEFFLGPDLLVAPVLSETDITRKVYLPAGVWVDFFHPEKVYHGSQVIQVNCGLGEIALFARQGSIIPMRKESKSNVYDNLNVEMEFKCFGNDPCDGILYLDDGLSRDYQKAKFGLFKLHRTARGTSVEMQLVQGEGFETQYQATQEL